MASSQPSHSLQNEQKTEDSEFPLKEIGNEGLTKRILRAGITWQTPFSGDQVEVHFRGQIENGALLESSYDKGSPFRFKLGQCEVIKGWDEGVATMKKGERAILRIPPNLAYGEAGSPPLIPPNATLIYDIEMLSWSTIRDLTGGDGGIMKKVIREGEGFATPRDADEVLVKYEARLEDGMLISECDKGVEFKVSDGYLCPAMSIAVKTMRKGEIAELDIKFLNGLNQNSNRTAKLDGLADSMFTTIKLELVSWNIVIDVSGDKKILKKIKKAGEGFDRPNEGSQVKVIYLCKQEDGTVIERKGSKEEPFEFTTQEEQVHEGLESAIMTMRKSEQALVIISAEYLCDSNSSKYGNSTNKKVLYYEVELVDFIKEKPFWKLDTQEKIEACERKKHDGNLLFKAENFRRAYDKYDKAVKYIEFDHSFSEDEKRRANSLRVSCNLNKAACKLKLGEFTEVSRLCTKVLEQDPLNVKALYRRSQAYLKTSDLEKAEADIKKALTLDPNNRDLKIEYKELKIKQKEYSRHEADIFSKCFQG